MNNLLDNKSLLITGGTGSLGSAIVRRVVTGEYGLPKAITIFSRDELKQADMAEMYRDCDYIHFVIGDVRDFQSLVDVVRDADIIVHAAAMKRVEACERFPDEALKTNYLGASNIIRAIEYVPNEVECVVGVSSDKGTKPLNVYGMTKALQEQRLIAANNGISKTRFICVRYGNVMGSRGSVIPIWQKQIKEGGPVTITDPSMTRFLISLDQAVDTLFDAILHAEKGEIYIPHSLPAASIGDIADAVIGGNDCAVQIVGRGSGEKIHETLITSEEVERTIIRDKYYVVTGAVQPNLVIDKEYISNDYVLNAKKLRVFLLSQKIIGI